MRTTIDRAGRVVIPKDLRDKLGLDPGEVEITEDGAGVRIEPVAEGELVMKDGRLVVKPVGRRLTDEDVRSIRLGLQR